MLSRCTRQKDISWKRYGGRGITFPLEWKNFLVFLRDMGDCPEGKSLDRIDNDKSYSKDNCRWATPREQAVNTARVKRTVSGIAGVNWRASRARWVAYTRVNGKLRQLYYGVSFDEALLARRNWESSFDLGALNA